MPIPNLEVRVEGLEGLSRSLNELADRYGPREARRAFRSPMLMAMEPVRRQISITTPIDTGELAESVDLRGSVGNAFDRRRNPGVVYVVRAGWFWRRPPSLWARALRVEYGSVFHRPKRVLRNALEQNATNVIETFSSQLRTELIALARRLNAQNSPR